MRRITQQRLQQLKNVADGRCAKCGRRKLGIYSENCDSCARRGSLSQGVRPWRPGSSGRPPKRWRQATRRMRLPGKYLAGGAVSRAWLIAVRLRAGLLQLEAAAQIGIHATHLSAVERGRAPIPERVLAWYERVERSHAQKKSFKLSDAEPRGRSTASLKTHPKTPRGR
jgi:hypothetical protein